MFVVPRLDDFIHSLTLEALTYGEGRGLWEMAEPQYAEELRDQLKVAFAHIGAAVTTEMNVTDDGLEVIVKRQTER